MDIEKYLSEKLRHLARNAGRIHNFNVFDFNYIPAKPLMREEVKPLIDALLRYRQTGIANHALILGTRGSGKSVLSKPILTGLRSRSYGNSNAYADPDPQG